MGKKEVNIDEYIEFMNDARNIRNCSNCPENKDKKSFIDLRYPCGQYNCWVIMHTEGVR